MNPRVFISHAREDKERFVAAFAERLRDKGLDVWYDQWEMLPGDSLVGKIFNEGLKQSDAIIVVLSENSIGKPWVQAELDIAVVKRIEDSARLIPVRLDSCSIPECLRSTFCQNIADLKSYNAELDHIVAAIFGQYDRPALGVPPVYATAAVLQIDGLCRNDRIFLEEACRIALEQGHPVICDPETLQGRLLKRGLTFQDILDAQEVLTHHFYIETERTFGPLRLYEFGIETEGFRLFAEAGGIEEYPAKIRDVMQVIDQAVRVQRGTVTNSSIESDLQLPAMLVEHILECLKNEGLVDYQCQKGGHMTVYRTSPELRRMLEQN